MLCFSFFYFFSYDVDNCSLQICVELCWSFNEDCFESVDQICKDDHHLYINPTHP